MTYSYLVFHLNLAFSSIKAASRPEVIQKCYWPLLKLAENTQIPLGIELTGWTLQQIQLLDNPWVDYLKTLIQQQRVELIGSGWSQLIGPLVPYRVNRWNQQLGLDAYQNYLGVLPKIVLVNEMAFSTGMIDVYVDAGYTGMIMDRDNVRMALGMEDQPYSAMPTHALGCGSHVLPVLWSDSIIFQRLQRVVHGDIGLADYWDTISQYIQRNNPTILPIYCNDAEIFDYRPGRFVAESQLHAEGEWKRLEDIGCQLRDTFDCVFLRPSEALQQYLIETPHQSKKLTQISQPIPVKKQAKYNINRWAVGGRDSLWLNTQCHQLHQGLLAKKDSYTEDWKTLCELWSSDFRTHITQDRWDNGLTQLQDMREKISYPSPIHKQNFEKNSSVKPQIIQDDEGIYLTVKTHKVHLILNLRRGLAIQSLAFQSQGMQPVIGTLCQGHFDTIEWGVDLYSGGILIEIPGERLRLTDLEWVNPTFVEYDDCLCIEVKISLPIGVLKKTIKIHLEKESVQFQYVLEPNKRPAGIVRVGFFTFMEQTLNFPLTLSCVNGGPSEESFLMNSNVHFGQAVSTLVSSTTALGATDGRLCIKDTEGKSLFFQWNPAECAAMPMIKYQKVNNRHLARLFFSLSELDDTFRDGGSLAPLMVELRTRDKCYD